METVGREVNVVAAAAAAALPCITLTAGDVLDRGRTAGDGRIDMPG